jgi:hypothetical protein
MTRQQIRSIATLTVKRGLLFLTLWFVSLSLYRSLQQVDWSKIHFRPTFIASGFILVVVATLTGLIVVKLVYRVLGVKLGSCQAFCLLTIPPLGKYLPGKVFSLMGHVAMAQSYGAPIVIGGTAIGILTSSGLAAPTLLGAAFFLSQRALSHNGIPPDLGISSLMLATLLFSLHPGVCKTIITFALKLFRKPPIEFSLGIGTWIILMSLTIMQTLLYMLGFAVAVFGVLQLPFSVLPNIIAASCLANVLGFVALFAPGGLGVREGILLVMLTPLVGTGNAGLIALLTRLIQTLIDAISAAAGFLTLRIIQ